MDMTSAENFDAAHAAWWKNHRLQRVGERGERMKEGQGYLEKRFLQQIWWPLFGSFESLHPEYEVRDFHDGYRYVDLAYLQRSAKLAIETDGYASHVRQVSRRRHGDLSLRDLHLAADGWTVLHISSELIESRPRQVQQALQQIVWHHAGRGDESERLRPDEEEALRFAALVGGEVTPKLVSERIGRSRNTTLKVLHALAERKLLAPGKWGASTRVRTYVITPKERIASY